MKLIIPYADKMELADIHLTQLAEFCGIPWERLSLDRRGVSLPEYLEATIREKNSCFVVSPPAIRKALSAEVFPPDLGSYLVSRFPYIIVHNLHPDPFTDSTVRCLSGGCFQSVHPVERSGLSYKITADSKDVCSTFSNLVFGPINRSIDRILAGDRGATVQPLISINDQPLLAGLPVGRAQVFFLATGDIVDLSANVDSLNWADCFSQLVPPIMLFRHIFRAACWHPNRHHATLIIDDPLLRKNYGFLNYERLLELMDQHDFHTCIAFIPYNCRRSSSAIARIFRDRPDRYSLCFHGNDHTAAEFGVSEIGQLNAILKVASSRMDIHQSKTGVRHDRVMVFPQGNFSVDAMMALKTNNFSAAVNTIPHPMGESLDLSIADLIQPAIMKYGLFPLFLRKYVCDMSPQDIAFNLFFGKPVLIVEHHGIFNEIERITELVSYINSLAPQIRWTNLQTAIENSYLQRRAPDGTLNVLAYAGCGRIENCSEAPLRCSIVKCDGGSIAAEQVLMDDHQCVDSDVKDGNIRFFFDVAPGVSRIFSVIYRNEVGSTNLDHGFQRAIKVLLRRRLSEVRDNYLSKTPSLLSVSQSVHRRLSKRLSS